MLNYMFVINGKNKNNNSKLYLFYCFKEKKMRQGNSK